MRNLARKVLCFSCMKKILLTQLFTAASIFSFAQSVNGFQFASEKEAKEMIDLIVNVVGLKSNFEIKSGRVDNAAAVIYNGKRYILYNPIFISQVKDATRTDWSGLSIVAHEVGHHLNGHTLLGSGSTPAIELEADEFSGFVLRRLGATLQESQLAMRVISGEKGSPTHPGRSKRLAAIQSGWNRAEMQIAGITKPVLPKKGSEIARRESTSSKAVSVNYVFPAQYIAYNVLLFPLAGETIHITIQNHLVRVTSEGYQVIGQLVREKSGRYLVLNGDQRFHIDSRGGIISASGKKIGALKLPAKKLL